MDAVKYLKERRRMTDNCTIRCNDCPFRNNGKNENCDEFELDYPEEAVKIVAKWAEEHPVKTRHTEFLKMFPNAEIKDGLIQISPCRIDTVNNRRNGVKCTGRSCSDCYRDYWFTEIE